MEKNIKQVNKWFWAWQDDKEEAWLNEMSLAGWHLVSAKPFGQYTFISGEPGNFVYRLDFQTSPRKNFDQYLQLFKDAGWEYVDEMMGWQYFRKLAENGETPEIFTDNESKIQKYQRLVGYLVIFLPILIMLLVQSPRVYGTPLTILFSGLAILLLSLYTIAFVNLLRRINQLKKGSL